jgi:hypothetical protein
LVAQATILVDKIKRCIIISELESECSLAQNDDDDDENLNLVASVTTSVIEVGHL